MPKYINADELKAFIDAGKYRNPCERVFSENDIIDMVNKMPSADVVEVVRCKDCKYYKESIHFAPEKMCYKYTDNRGHKIGYIKSDYDFCSYGERKETNDVN